MSLDINRKSVTKNAFRVTKDRNLTALRVRVPGGKITADLLLQVSEIANKYGNGRIHMTTRQGFEILGIKWEDMDEVNNLVQPLIEGLEINQYNKGEGYSAAGTRNIAACIGNEVCPKAQYDTTDFAKEIESRIFPNDFHFKVALTGCPNDCQKVRMHDFGIIGMALPVLDKSRCISCGLCVKKCSKLSTKALSFENFKPERDHSKCIGCGECVVNCPTGAWKRDEDKYFRLSIMGRTGKKNPRLGEDFILWADRENIIKIIENTYSYVDNHIDRTLPKEHIGYIVDRTGMEQFKKEVLSDIELQDIAILKETVNFNGITYPNNIE